MKLTAHLSAHRLCRYEVCLDLIWYHWMVMGRKYMWQMRIYQRMRQMMKIVPMTVYLKLILMIMTIILTDMMLRVQIMELRQMHV